MQYIIKLRKQREGNLTLSERLSHISYEQKAILKTAQSINVLQTSAKSALIDQAMSYLISLNK